ncbi:hypothetical protein GCM10009801_08580 [Streptomyces albiaxialis]|uniref:Uncharacterized protein n=1 Tax=Streptomyces albiaxialis TaxID=329523 RepID=A0ABN2VLV7_9ACTN
MPGGRPAWRASAALPGPARREIAVKWSVPGAGEERLFLAAVLRSHALRIIGPTPHGFVSSRLDTTRQPRPDRRPRSPDHGHVPVTVVMVGATTSPTNMRRLPDWLLRMCSPLPRTSPYTWPKGPREPRM